MGSCFQWHLLWYVFVFGFDLIWTSENGFRKWIGKLRYKIIFFYQSKSGSNFPFNFDITINPRYVYWYCMYVCMIAFILVAVTSILQAYAVIEMVPFALGTSIILLIICWFMELIGGILIIIYGVEQSPALTNSLDTVFFRLIYDYDINPRSSRILTIIQEYVSRKTSTRYWQSP